MRIAHINETAHLAAGRMASDLCRMAQKAGHEALLCYGWGVPCADVPSIRVGDTPDAAVSLRYRRSAAPSRIRHQLTRRFHRLSANTGRFIHAGLSRITGRSGFYSRNATKRFIQQLRLFSPDLVHLHNLHGHYLHLPTLFAYLKETRIPVVWTLHDCWPFTGHCTCCHFPIQPYTNEEDAPPAHAPAQCSRWQKGCHHCPLKNVYPRSLMDQSARNFAKKKALITSLDRLVLTVPSRWMKEQVSRSFLGRYPVALLPGGIDLTQYTPCADERHMQDIALFYGLDQLNGRRMVLSVSDQWDERKGMADLIQLARMLGDDYCVVPAGLSESQTDALPYYMLGVPATANVKDLCVLYTAADVYVSLRQGETMDMTLIEAMACGTQVICYDTAALPEAVIPQTGEVIPTGDIAAAADAVRRLCDDPKDPLFCIARAAQYGANLRYEPYLTLYDQAAQ